MKLRLKSFCAFRRRCFLIPLTSTNFDKLIKPGSIPCQTAGRDIRKTSHPRVCLTIKQGPICIHGAWTLVGSFLFQSFHSPRPGQVCHLLSWPESGQSDMTLLACVPSGNSTWIRYRKEASRAIVWGLTQAVDWTVGLLLCWYCWSQAHRCGTAWTAEA